MTDPIKLAEELSEVGSDPDKCPRCGEIYTCCSHPEERRLIAAALRLAEADIALIDHDDAKPIHPKPGEMQAWSDERDVLIGRHADAEADYRAAREGRP